MSTPIEIIGLTGEDKILLSNKFNDLWYGLLNAEIREVVQELPLIPVKSTRRRVVGEDVSSHVVEVHRTMAIHVKQGFDPKISTRTETLCGLAPEYATAGYNGEWELVYHLDTGQAVHQLDICPACLKAIQAYQRRHKRPTLP